MKPEKVFKRYDIRGEYPEEINEEFAERIGKALGSFVAENFDERIVVSHDNKDSSETLKQPLIKGLRSTGVNVLDTGEGPTDYAAFSGREKGAVSVQVTSSHLPLNFNGFKLMYPEGNGFVNEDLNKVKDLFRNKEFRKGNGSFRDVESKMKKAYLERLKEKASELGSSSIDRKIVVDTLGGASKNILPEALRDMGAEVIDLADNKDKEPYRDPPNPKPEKLEELEKKVEKENADLGLATDMDADRVTVYKDGFLSGDEVFGLMARTVESDLVASIDSSRSLEQLQEENNREVFYTRVGDPFVMRTAIEEGVELAGEPNGHYSVLDFVPYNSGSLTALIIAGINIEEGLDELPGYSVEKFSFKTEEKEQDMEMIKKAVEREYGVISEVDGVKFETRDCDVLVRPSGTSPKIRVIVESKNEEDLEREIDEIREIVQNP